MADLDELLKALEERLKEEGLEKPEKPQQDSVNRFIEKMNIRRGLDRIPNYVIFYTYKKKYKRKEGEEKWSKTHFFRLFNRYFDQARVGKQRYYLLDASSFDLTREGRIEAQTYDKEYTRQIKIKTGKIKPKKPRRKRSDEKG